MDLILELGKIIGNQGPWAAACVGLFGLLVLSVLRWVDAERRCYSGQLELQEKRVIERESTVLALRAGNETNDKLADALSANTDAVLRHTQLTIELSKDFRADQDHWKLRAAGWEGNTGDIQRVLNAIQLAITKLL